MPIWLLLLLGLLGILVTEFSKKQLELWLVKHELVEDLEKDENLAERPSPKP